MWVFIYVFVGYVYMGIYMCVFVGYEKQQGIVSEEGESLREVRTG